MLSPARDRVRPTFRPATDHLDVLRRLTLPPVEGLQPMSVPAQSGQYAALCEHSLFVDRHGCRLSGRPMRVVTQTEHEPGYYCVKVAFLDSDFDLMVYDVPLLLLQPYDADLHEELQRQCEALWEEDDRASDRRVAGRVGTALLHLTRLRPTDAPESVMEEVRQVIDVLDVHLRRLRAAEDSERTSDATSLGDFQVGKMN